MTGNLHQAAALAVACALIAAGTGCAYPARSAAAGQRGQRCPPPVAGRIVDETGKPVVATGIAAIGLAPPHPDGGLVCRYEPTTVSQPELKLQRSAHLNPRNARHIAAMLSHLPTHSTGIVNCPMSRYQHDTLIFTYPHGPAADVNVGISGFPGPCDPVTNGVIYRPSTPALLDTLTALVGHP